MKSGETVSFRLERYKTHNVCITPLEDTKIFVAGGEIVDPGKWVTGVPDILDFKVKFTTVGNAQVRIERFCTKTGLMTVEANGTVSAGSITSSTPLSTTPATTPSTSPTTTVEKANDGTVPSATANTASEAAAPSSISRFISQITFDSVGLQLWYIFFLLGLVFFLFKLSQYRKTILFLGVIVLGFYLGGCPEPVGTPFILLLGNSALFKIALVLLIIPVVISLIWGRVFCGWMCPLGGVQEIIYTDKASLSIPYQVDKYLKLLKYIVLAIFLFLTWSTGLNYWGEYEPFKVLFNFDGTLPAIIILAVTIAISVVTERTFCRYICPLGAILSVTSRLAPYRIKAVPLDCKGCKVCSKNLCPMNTISMDDSIKLAVVDNSECIRCLRCVDSCRFKAMLIGREKNIEAVIKPTRQDNT